MLDNDRDSQWNETEEFYSDQELTTDESSYEEYKPWSNDLQHTSVMRDPLDPPGMSHLHRQNSVQQCEDGSSVWTETDGGNSDICNVADFSSEEEDISVEWNSGRQGESIIGVTTCTYSDLSDSEDSEWEDAENRKVREFVDHDDLEYGDRPVADAASELMIRPDEILVVGTLPAVIDHPEPTKNVWRESGKQNIPVRKR